MNSGVRFLQPAQMNTDLSPYNAPAQAKVFPIQNSPRFAADPISIDDLYQEASASSSVLGHALRELASAKDAIQGSLAALKREDLIESDDAMQQFQAMLPELFCCRTLGDGFGAIINALRFSFQNAGGIPLSENQIGSMGRAVERLRGEPFLDFDSAVQIITRLEDSGLIVDPPAFATLTDLLDVESFR